MNITLRNEGDHVLFIVNGVLIADIPWDAARGVAEAMRKKSLLAEEYAKREHISDDQAILTRAGVPVGLITDPKILQLAQHKAQHDGKLRRYMPHVKSQEVFGTPTVQNVKGGNNGRKNNV